MGHNFFSFRLRGALFSPAVFLMLISRGFRFTYFKLAMLFLLACSSYYAYFTFKQGKKGRLGVEGRDETLILFLLLGTLFTFPVILSLIEALIGLPFFFIFRRSLF
jgi:hypothetical protein